MARECSFASSHYDKMTDSSRENFFVIRDNGGKSFGFITTVGDVIHIVFRGTLPKQVRSEVLQDLKRGFATFDLIQGNQLLIHRGIYGIYKIIRDNILPNLNKVMKNYKRMNNNNIKKISLTGSSLGGALATICALDFKTEKRNGLFYDRLRELEINVCTIMSPKIFNEPLKDRYDRLLSKNTIRIFIQHDPVPDNPQDDTWVDTGYLGGKILYHHVDNRYDLPPKNQFRLNAQIHDIDESYIPALEAAFRFGNKKFILNDETHEYNLV